MGITTPRDVSGAANADPTGPELHQTAALGKDGPVLTTTGDVASGTHPGATPRSCDGVRHPRNRTSIGSHLQP